MELKICSFNVSKQLKDKGFDIPVLMCYEWMEHKTHLCQNIQEKGKLENWNSHTGEENDYVLIFYSAPTLELAKMWLRDEYTIIISIIFELNSYEYCIDNGYNIGSEGSEITFKTYEQALETAIVEALKLINN